MNQTKICGVRKQTTPPHDYIVWYGQTWLTTECPVRAWYHLLRLVDRKKKQNGQ